MNPDRTTFKQYLIYRFVEGFMVERKGKGKYKMVLNDYDKFVNIVFLED